MGYSTPITTITTRMKAQWALSAYSAVPVVYDNEAEDPPLPDPSDVAGSSWVRQTVLYDDTVGLTFSGSSKDHTIGVASYQIFIPLAADIDNGLDTGFAMAEAIRGFYNRNEVSGVVFSGPNGEGPSITNVGKSDDTMTHQINVTVPWQYFD